jgi:hypothetical protein
VGDELSLASIVARTGGYMFAAKCLSVVQGPFVSVSPCQARMVRFAPFPSLHGAGRVGLFPIAARGGQGGFVSHRCTGRAGWVCFPSLHGAGRVGLFLTSCAARSARCGAPACLPGPPGPCAWRAPAAPPPSAWAEAPPPRVAPTCPCLASWTALKPPRTAPAMNNTGAVRETEERPCCAGSCWHPSQSTAVPCRGTSSSAC